MDYEVRGVMQQFHARKSKLWDAGSIMVFINRQTRV